MKTDSRTSEQISAHRRESLDLAERVLDRPHADPDDDLAVLARALQLCNQQRSRFRMALLSISEQPDYTAPEGMVRIARTAMKDTTP